MRDFKENLKVTPDKLIKNIDIIKSLNEQEQVYNPNMNEMSERTNILRSGENVFYNMMLISGMLFTLNDTSNKIIDTSIIGRVKSPESIARKSNRIGRKNKKSRDIIAYNIIIDRIHNSDDFYNVFRSDKIQSLYNERKSNIDLMQMVVDFINSFEMYGLSSELDESLTIEETREVSKKRLDGMKDNCVKIAENIDKYNNEELGNSRGFPINQSMRVMCEELLKREIQNATQELYSERHRLEREIKENKANLSEDMLAIKRNNLKNLKARINLLESKKNWKTNELVEILSGKIDKEKVMMYIPIIEQLRKEEMDAMIANGEHQKDESNEKKYCQLLILVLYQLTKLEFVKDGQYEGLIYNNIWTNLHNSLKEYKNCEIDKGTYGNVTFESLQKLTTNLIRLNARLSDQLQYEIAKYEMDYYLKSIINQFTGKEDIVGEEKIKPNGYVSIHYDAETFEIKVTTHYRDRVASKGSAAYGSGRIENQNEKKREIKRLNYKKYLLKLSGKEKTLIIKKARIHVDYANKIKDFYGNGKNLSRINRKDSLREWKKELLKSTPRYFLARYDADKNVVKIEFFGALQNVQKYYSETSVIEIRDEVKMMIDDIKKYELTENEALLSDKPYIIEVSRNQYHDFVNFDLRDMKGKIEKKLSEADKKENIDVKTRE